MLFIYNKIIPGSENNDLIIMGDLNWDFLKKKGVSFKMISEICSELGLGHIKN